MEEWSRTLPEDTVEYSIYSFPQQSRVGSASKSAAKENLKEARKVATRLVNEHLKDYIWQREAFALTLREDGKDEAGEVHLHGRTNFGDSIEDEWLIVWLLREISKQFPQLWIRVTDSMGEFLLVEAANVLPAWVDPEIAEYRVWLNKGELRLIPVAPVEKEAAQVQPGPLNLARARQHIYEEKPTLHPKLVENEAFHRLRDYPGRIQKNQHYALVTIPRKLASLLHENPTYISPAVDAFYLRDPIAMKPLAAKSQAGLLFPPKDFVTMRTKFTRVGFAQVKSQRFAVPTSWQGAEKSYDDARFRDRAELGMKVAAGFEMLLNDPQRQDERVVREMRMLLSDVDSGEVELPTDEEIASWGTHGDDEKWMDIDYEDFEDELSGKKSTGSSTKGFGDKAAQENLRKMVQRFEDFLKDDTLQADDYDNDSDNSDEDSSDEESNDEGEHKAGSFTEDEFTKMMREMMGMPEDVMRELMTSQMSEEEIKRFADSAQDRNKAEHFDKDKGKGKAKAVDDDDNDDDDDDEDEINELSAAMERELKGVGALDISDPERLKAFETIKNTSAGDTEGCDDSDDGELLDEDYNLVANMLESFKSQGGAAGPGGNLMNMLGLKMPRDEEDDDSLDGDHGESGSK